MQSQTAPITKDLVLLGGGHSHVIVLRMFGMNPLPGLRITLISPEVRSPYSGMLPGAVAGHYSLDDMHIELMPLCQFARAGFVRGAADGIDPDRKLVYVRGRPPISYDVLSIDIGITPSLDLEGAENVIPVKPISTFLARFASFDAPHTEACTSQQLRHFWTYSTNLFTIANAQSLANLEKGAISA